MDGHEKFRLAFFVLPPDQIHIIAQICSLCSVKLDWRLVKVTPNEKKLSNQWICSRLVNLPAELRLPQIVRIDSMLDFAKKVQTSRFFIGVINNLRSSFLLAVHQHHKQFNEKSVINIKGGSIIIIWKDVWSRKLNKCICMTMNIGWMRAFLITTSCKVSREWFQTQRCIL